MNDVLGPNDLEGLSISCGNILRVEGEYRQVENATPPPNHASVLARASLIAPSYQNSYVRLQVNMRELIGVTLKMADTSRRTTHGSAQ